MPFSGAGSGTLADPYLITDAGQLQEMEDEVSAHYEVINAIDATGTSAWNGGDGFVPVGFFTGSLNLGGFSITGLVTVQTGTDRAGLFGVNFNGDVSDGALVDFDITGAGQSGALIGRMAGGTVARVAVRGGSVDSSEPDTGALIGFVNAGSVDDCCQTACTIVSAGGGLIGDNRSTTALARLYSTGSVPGTDGGLIDSNSGTAPTDSFWDTQTSGSSTSAAGTGYNTTAMRAIDTYTDTATLGLDTAWDMVALASHDGEFATAVWAIDDGVDYPVLWFEVEAGADVTLDAAAIAEPSRAAAVCGVIASADAGPAAAPAASATEAEVAIDTRAAARATRARSAASAQTVISATGTMRAATAQSLALADVAISALADAKAAPARGTAIVSVAVTADRIIAVAAQAGPAAVAGDMQVQIDGAARAIADHAANATDADVLIDAITRAVAGIADVAAPVAVSIDSTAAAHADDAEVLAFMSEGTDGRLLCMNIKSQPAHTLRAAAVPALNCKAKSEVC